GDDSPGLCVERYTAAVIMVSAQIAELSSSGGGASGIQMTFVTVALVVLSCVAVCSIIEGIFHQFILHTPQRKFLGGALFMSYHYHAIEHHPAYRAEDYHRPAPDTEQPISLGPFMWPALMIVTSPITIGVWLWLG